MKRILFGDNQFFGINHFSEEKARQQAMKFQDLDAILDVLQSAFQSGVSGFMCTTHDTVEKIADEVRRNPDEVGRFHLLPGHALRPQICQCGDRARLYGRAQEVHPERRAWSIR